MIKFFLPLVLLSFLFISCGKSPEDMVEEYNNNLIVINASGTEWTLDGIHYIKTDLITEEDTVEVKKGYLKSIECTSNVYKSYYWTLKDADGNEIHMSVNNAFRIWVQTVTDNIDTGEYTLSVTAENYNNQFFTDTITVNVI